ncbi:MAG: MmcQ/YjbR family DNA-binding protein [Gemmatimonadota bacterium]
MTAADFRRAVLNFPEVIEGSHMGHADFRVGGKIIATLGYPNARCAVVMLPPHDQDLLVRDHPQAFTPAAGKWGASGSTNILLDAASVETVTMALEAAWRKRAPKRLVR